ncbi:hypothetical protein ccbrp13_41130 [Ktedonobacteria bacterium brp13]|nr:hypothetical protein ccbrp13_41130 [Ktedonobacteria bacterium brp13]
MSDDGSRSPDRKYEYIDGSAYMMNGGSVAHDRIAYNARRSLCGPLAIRNAQPGMTLVVHIQEIRPGTWGWNSAGG